MGSIEELQRLRTIGAYQFGAGAGRGLFPDDEDLTVERSRTGRARQIHSEPGRLVSVTTDGRFTLGLEGGRRLLAALNPPAYRVTVGEESEPFVRDGKNAFAKFVLDVDPGVRPKDEVLVVDQGDELLGVGRAELSADGMQDFDVGMAVMVRDGAGK